MKFVLLHGPTWDPGEARAALDAEQIERKAINALGPGTIDERPTVLLLDEPLRRILGPGGVRSAADAGASVVGLGAPGEADIPADLPGADLVSAFLTHPAGPRQLFTALRAAYREAAMRIDAHRARAEIAARSKEITDLTRIGVALSTERNYDVLLDLILTQARQITQSDGGS
ncbi:MAG: hypothetical protein AABY85_11075, partial [Gemmatimonadota bacterium]